MLGRIIQVTPSCRTDHRTFTRTQHTHTTITLTYANTIRHLQVNKSVGLLMCLFLLYLFDMEQSLVSIFP